MCGQLDFNFNCLEHFNFNFNMACISISIAETRFFGHFHLQFMTNKIMVYGLQRNVCKTSTCLQSLHHHIY